MFIKPFFKKIGFINKVKTEIGKNTYFKTHYYMSYKVMIVYYIAKAPTFHLIIIKRNGIFE
ncbi:hypothetical protein AT270_30230 [Bacillus cereus]|nr:hypothetical protein AT270_30230 [Bacillus cereus]MBG9937697.1 hypothetical protein [Bacillus tropicus]OTY55746.1 hypothetical protein BK748_16455 [Bacillus thuringiensis serovar graciosensis]